MMFTDFLKRPLEVGDSVIFITKGYRDYTLGRVDSFTPQKVRVLKGYNKYNNEPEFIIQDP